MDISEAVGVTESVDDGADVERVRVETLEPKVVEEAESFVDIASRAETVELFGPERPVSDTFQVLLVIMVGGIGENR